MTYSDAVGKIVTEYVQMGDSKIRILLKKSDHIEAPWLVLWPGQCDAAESLFRVFDLTQHNPINIAVLDPPGHGLSDEPLDYSLKSQQNVWESVLDRLEVTKAYIGGYSYGAYSAAMCSLALSKRVLGLVLVEGGYLALGMGREDYTLESQIDRISASFRRRRYTSWEEARRVVKSKSPVWNEYDEAEFRLSMVEKDGFVIPRETEETMIMMEQAIAPFSPAVVDELTCPILILHATLPIGMNDIREAALAKFSQYAPQTQIVPIPNCGHTIKEHLPFVMREILTFILKDS